MGFEQVVGGVDERTAWEASRPQELVQAGLHVELVHGPARPWMEVGTEPERMTDSVATPQATGKNLDGRPPVAGESCQGSPDVSCC